MTKEFILQGLDCANCAAKIEADIKKMDGIISASVNFATAKLLFEVAADYSGDIYKDIERIVHIPCIKQKHEIHLRFNSPKPDI